MKSNKGWIAAVCCLVIVAVVGFFLMNGQVGGLKEKLTTAENTITELTAQV